MMKVILNGIRWIDNLLYRITKLIVALIIGAQMMLVFIGVIWRYFFNSPIIWVDELTSYLLVMVTFLGCFVAFIEKKLASVTILPLYLKGLKQKLLMLFANIICVFVLVLIINYGILLCRQPAVTSMVTPVLQWPLIIFYSMLPVTMCFLLFHMILVVYGDWTKKPADLAAEMQNKINGEVV
ncbi:MAG TPA: TRAP transporter small permease subunit [Anaerovoracaceae bacterium]|nr:TRAP transporter small permease subunit [Anaerovoracaceae bacterium]